MEFLVIGVAVAFNCIIIKEKFQRGRIEDGALDLIVLVIITMVTSGSYGALVVGTIASALFSLYLMASPPTFFTNSKILNKVKAKLRTKLESKKDRIERFRSV